MPYDRFVQKLIESCRREAAGHPGVIVAEAFLKQQQKDAANLLLAAQSVGVLAQPIAGPSHRPSVEWRTAFLARFANLRAVSTSGTMVVSLC